MTKSSMVMLFLKNINNLHKNPPYNSEIGLISMIINLKISEVQTKQTMESSKYIYTRFALFVFFYILVVDFFWIQHLCLYLYQSTFRQLMFLLKCPFRCLKNIIFRVFFVCETFHIYFIIFGLVNNFGCV